MSKPYKTIRAVVEVRVPQHVTEKALVWKLKEIIKWPIQLGYEGDRSTLVKPQFKQYSRVRAYENRIDQAFGPSTTMGKIRRRLGL